MSRREALISTPRDDLLVFPTDGAASSGAFTARSCREHFAMSILLKDSRLSSTNLRLPGSRENVHGKTLQEVRWVLKDAASVELPAPARKTCCGKSKCNSRILNHASKE